MLALLGALTQQYEKNHHDLNAQRIIDKGTRLQASIIEKKTVETGYRGIFSIAHKSIEHRVYIKITQPPHQGKIVWQNAQPEIYERLDIGSTVHVYIKHDDVFIEELTVKKLQSKGFLLSAFGLLCLAILSNIKAKQLSRQTISKTV